MFGSWNLFTHTQRQVGGGVDGPVSFPHHDPEHQESAEGARSRRRPIRWSIGLDRGQIPHPVGQLIWTVASEENTPFIASIVARVVNDPETE
jgi:hypothetical protein